MLGVNKKGHIIEKWNDNGKKIWSEQLSMTVSEILNAITTDEENNIYIAGFTVGDIGGRNKGGADIPVAKYSKDGKMVWINQFGTKKDDFARDIKIDKGGELYITGSIFKDLKDPKHMRDADAFLSKLDENGEVLWSRQVERKEKDEGVESTVDKKGNIYLLGCTTSDRQEHNGFIIKYNKGGDELWTKNFGDNYIPSGIILDEDTSLYVVGQERGKRRLIKLKQK